MFNKNIKFYENVYKIENTDKKKYIYITIFSVRILLRQ